MSCKNVIYIGNRVVLKESDGKHCTGAIGTVTKFFKATCHVIFDGEAVECSIFIHDLRRAKSADFK